MPCTPSACDIHDYMVAAPWCRYAWALAQEDDRAVTIESVRREIWQAIEEVHDTLREDLRLSRVKKRPFSSRAAQEAREAKEEKRFKGFDV